MSQPSQVSAGYLQQIRSTLLLVFTRTHRLTLQVEATRFLEDVLQRIPPSELDESVRHIAAAYLQQNDAPRLVDVNTIKNVVEGLLQQDSSASTGGASTKFFDVVSAFDLPALSFEPHRKTFIPYEPFTFSEAILIIIVDLGRLLSLRTRLRAPRLSASATILSGSGWRARTLTVTACQQRCASCVHPTNADKCL